MKELGGHGCNIARKQIFAKAGSFPSIVREKSAKAGKRTKAHVFKSSEGAFYEGKFDFFESLSPHISYPRRNMPHPEW
jgi:hypothetical protein